MKLTPEIKKKIDDYFDSILPEQLLITYQKYTMKNLKSLPTTISQFTKEQNTFLRSQGMKTNNGKYYYIGISDFRLYVYPKFMAVEFNEAIIKSVIVSDNPMVMGDPFENCWNELVEFIEKII